MRLEPPKRAGPCPSGYRGSVAHGIGKRLICPTAGCRVRLRLGAMDGLEITPLPQRHIALLRQFQTSDERAGPSRAPPQRPMGFTVGDFRWRRQEPLERRALRRLCEKRMMRSCASAT
jgi:hypothetical protein